MARGVFESRRVPVAVLAIRRHTRADALDARGDHLALRERIRGVRDGLRHQPGHQPRSDSDRRVLQRERAQQPASGASLGVRDVRRARGDDDHLHPAAAPRCQVGQVKPRRHIAPSAFFWLLVAFLYFAIPLLATFIFSLKSNQTGKCCTAANYSWVIHNGEFWQSLKISFLLALETIVISLAIFVPTIYWVHLKVPKLRPVIAFLALIPFVVPPIVMVVGLLAFFKGSPSWFYA